MLGKIIRKKTEENDYVRRECCLEFICWTRCFLRSSAFSSRRCHSWFSC